MKKIAFFLIILASCQAAEKSPQSEQKPLADSAPPPQYKSSFDKSLNGAVDYIYETEAKVKKIKVKKKSYVDSLLCLEAYINNDTILLGQNLEYSFLDFNEACQDKYLEGYILEFYENGQRVDSTEGHPKYYGFPYTYSKVCNDLGPFSIQGKVEAYYSNKGSRSDYRSEDLVFEYRYVVVPQ